VLAGLIEGGAANALFAATSHHDQDGSDDRYADTHGLQQPEAGIQ
jgi:hypothetical protein